MGGVPVSDPQGFLSRFATVIKGQVTVSEHKTGLQSTKNNTSSRSSDVFLKTGLEMLSNSRELRRNEQLKSAIKVALESIEQVNDRNESIILKPLQIACRSGNAELAIIAVDCFGKLFSYNYWSQVTSTTSMEENIPSLAMSPPQVIETSSSLVDDLNTEQRDTGGTVRNIQIAIDAICDCFTGENTDERVQLQVLKALQAALSVNDYRFMLHGDPLIQCIRTVYHVFLVSKSSNVQQIAQGTMTQMVMTVMGRAAKQQSVRTAEDVLEFDNTQLLKDAIKVFCALCRLSTKPIPNMDGGSLDLRTTPIRGKLLTLYMIHDTVKTHPRLFTITCNIVQKLEDGGPQKTAFIDWVKEDLILSISRNATSPIPPVFEITYNLFGQILCHLRQLLKSEIGVFTCEIIVPLLERDTISWYQQFLILKGLEKALSESNDAGRLWTEIYLNYDCDPDSKAKENIWERLVLSIMKLLAKPQDRLTPGSTKSALEESSLTFFVTDAHSTGAPSLTSTNLTVISKEQLREIYSTSSNSIEVKRVALRFVTNVILAPLYKFCKQSSDPVPIEANDNNETEDTFQGNQLETFENNRQKKQTAIEIVQMFNLKPKKGIQRLKESNLLENAAEPKEIAQFLFHCEGIDKHALGEFLGEGDEQNICIMHNFVDLMNFENMKFVDALREFLQYFRLPGEAQKIDRFVLKFAERYLKGNPQSFSSADVAYVLAYSTIMLNTDQHNKMVKKRMTKAEFIRNNRGINDGKDLPESVLGNIFDEISTNEIVMKDNVADKVNGTEPHSNLTMPAAEILFFMKKDTGIQTLKNSEELAVKTEALLTNLMRSKTIKTNSSISSVKPLPETNNNTSRYHTASTHEHVRHMIASTGSAMISSLTASLQEMIVDISFLEMCLNGIKSFAFLVCFFEMDKEKRAILTALFRNSFLQDSIDITSRNVKSFVSLLEIILQEGNKLDSESWQGVVSCILQYEKLQLRHQELSGGDVTSKRNETSESAKIESEKVAVLIDKLFTSSPRFNGAAVVQLVAALCKASWLEISNSNHSEQSRLYCLQRIVEMSYYNMNRIKFEWSSLWQIIGDHFEQVASQSNSTIAVFALDKLRQLAHKFLEIEELPTFMFQKEFLRPFEVIIRKNPDYHVREMSLICLQQLVQAKHEAIRSGWKSILACIIKASRDTSESIVHLSFSICRAIQSSSFHNLVRSGCFSDLVLSITEFCKNRKWTKLSLQATELMRQCISTVEEHQKRVEERVVTDAVDVFWSPLLFSLHDIIMTSDLEVRTRSLQYLFAILKTWGPNYSDDFWQLLSKTIILPTFEDLKLNSSMINLQNSKFANKEELSIWLSTTLIQALRQTVELLSSCFERLSFLLPGILDLLIICILHENESITRIGSTLLQQLIVENSDKFNSQNWELIVNNLSKLLQDTTPSFLMFEIPNTKAGDGEQKLPSEVQSREHSPPPWYERQKAPPEKLHVQKQLSSCVVHLQVLETMHNILAARRIKDTSKLICDDIPDDVHEVFISLFLKSYEFARDFNSDVTIRTYLFRKGYMKQIPNLSKQETMSVTSYITFSMKHHQGRSIAIPPDSTLMRVCRDIINDFLSDGESRRKNAVAFKPVISTILSCLNAFTEEEFKLHIRIMYKSLIDLVLIDSVSDFNVLLHAILLRIGKVYDISNTDRGHGVE